MSLNVSDIRSQFKVFGASPAPVYLDSAATAQTPECVLEAMNDYYRNFCGNVHRGQHQLTDAATQKYEAARKTVADFISAKSQEIIFTKNCTEGINLAARSWVTENLNKGDTVALSILEHHSNVIPWLQLKESHGINVEWINLKDGALDLEQYQKLLDTGNVKLVSLTGQSNVLGIQPPIKEMAAAAHAASAKVLIDAAQLVVHTAVDVKDINCDFLAFSSHKLYGPTGIGALYIKEELMKETPPFLGGGMMISTVTESEFTKADYPHCFEAGTPPIAQAIGMAAAIEWLTKNSWSDIQDHEKALADHAHKALAEVPNLKILSPTGCAPISFTVEDIHPHDLTDLLGERGFALRAGHHCAEPLHKSLGITSSSRISFGVYNKVDEVDGCLAAMNEVIKLLT